jgi:hypothetical protein
MHLDPPDALTGGCPLQFWRLIIAAGCGLWAAGLHAQEIIGPAPAAQPAAAPTQPTTEPTVPAPTEPPKSTAGPPLEASQLDTFLLRDSKGNLVPVLNLPFDEFERLLRIKRGLAAPEPPAYSLDALTLTGTAGRDAVALQGVLTIRVRREGWVRVPLGLNRATLRQNAKHQGPGEHVMTFDATDGYVCWLSGADERPHTLTLQLTAAVTQSAGQSRLAIGLPHATESSLRLTIDSQRLDAMLVGGEGIVSVRPEGMARSEISVLGPAGDLVLTWQPGREPIAPGPALLEASGEVTVKVEGENRLSSDAKLRVRSYSGPLESVRVRLPPGMEIIDTSAVGYRLTAVAPAADSTRNTAAEGQLIEVVFDRPMTGVTEFRVIAVPGSSSSMGSWMPGRFDVIGAVRQRGTIDFVVEGDWQLVWQEDRSAQRLSVAADAASAKLAARFAYSRQPCNLQLRVAARPSRINVEPVHVVYVEDRQVRLESTLKYRVRGARAAGLEFNLGDWTIDRLTPGDLVELPPLPGQADDRRLLALRPGATLPTEFELKLEAHRPLDPAADEVVFALPRPVGDVVAPATVLIAPADNVELAPQAAKISGLSIDPAPSASRIASRQQPPLVYRDLGADEPAVFAADLRVRTQWTTVGARAVVKLSREQLQVEQRLDYRIAYERRRSFEILVPRSVLLSGPFQVRLGDQPLTPTPVRDAPQVGDATRFAVVTPTDQIGLCQLDVTYAVPVPKRDRQKPLALTLPLVVPADEHHQQVGGQQIEFVAVEGWRLDPDPEVSDEFSRPTPINSGSQQQFSLSRVTPLSRWIVQPADIGAPAAVSVGKVWIQSWLAASSRQDRAVFRLTTEQDQLRFRLPASPVAGAVQAGVNGQTLAVTVREPSTAILTLPAAARGHECVVELWYQLDEPAASGAWSTAKLRPPVLEGASPPRRLYWQLALPADEHLVIPPSRLAAEMHWVGNRWLATRRAALSQQQLELWIGASRQDPLPRGVNEYLYSTLGQSPSLEFTAMGRRPLLVIGAGLALLLGLAMLHLPALRRAESLLLTAVVVVGFGLALPDATALLGQTAALGLAVAAIVGIWMWLAAGPSLGPRPHATAHTTRPGSEIRSTEAPSPRTDPRPLSLGSASSTAPLAAGEQSL